MAEFSYKAVTAEGETITGRIAAPSQSDAVERLTRKGHYPITVKAASKTAAPAAGETKTAFPSIKSLRRAASSDGKDSARDHIRGRGLLPLTRELSHMTRAGLTIDQALRIMERGTADDRIRSTVQTLSAELRAGANLSTALERHGKPFDALYVSLVRAGETAGALPTVLDRLTTYLKRTKELRSAITVALIYPAILLAATVLSVTVLMVAVVPSFENLFSRSGANIPAATQAVIAVSHGLRNYGLILLIALLALVLVLRRALSGGALRARAHGLLLGLPILGPVLRRAEIARFTRSLGLMLDSGVGMLNAVGHALATVTNAKLARDLSSVVEPLRAGQGLADPLIATGALPDTAAQMIRVGEETGRLGPMLIEIADLYDNEVQEGFKRVLAALEPIIILTLGLVVGGIVLSLFAAIINLQSIAG